MTGNEHVQPSDYINEQHYNGNVIDLRLIFWVIAANEDHHRAVAVAARGKQFKAPQKILPNVVQSYTESELGNH